MRPRCFAASLLTCLASCADSTPSSPTPTLAPEPATYVVSGTVFATVDGVSRPLAGGLSLYAVQTEGLPPGLTRRMTWQGVTTDGNGRYTAQVPKSRVFVTFSGKRQPCLASGVVSRDTTIDLQVFPDGSPGTAPPSARPMITGFVYEATPQGRKPLRGAEILLDISQDAYIANTKTDEAGRFFLCRVDVQSRMDVFAQGYEPYQYAELISGVGDRFFEFEFSR